MTEASEQIWDVIVIGTGMGGGLAGRRLAENGLSVLFLERGPNGARGEGQGLNPMLADPVARQVRGYWPKPMVARINGRDSQFFAPIGAGVGGSSVFYAATLERPEPHDLDHSKDRPHSTGGWPVSYATFAPYFQEAEWLLHVSGAPDPLSKQPPSKLAEPAPLPLGEQQLMAGFQAAGLHPYHGHSAVRDLQGCKQCLGVKCPRDCKMDGRSAGVEPALETGRARLIADCKVTEIKGEADQVSWVEAEIDGQIQQFRARAYVLAAGALSSPRLLLASTAGTWTQGCGNGEDLVGRNLMFHLNEMFALWPKRDLVFEGPGKSLTLRDLYHVKGQRFGIIQAMGITARYGEILHFLTLAFDRSVWRHLAWLKPLLRLPARLAVGMFGDAKIFVGILEDLPYPENRVLMDADDPDILRVEYRFAPELLARRKRFRWAIRKAFKPWRHWFLNRGPELNFGHPCGTLAFGTDPKTSVLNPDCRLHDVHNLYVADASFMPSSMGVNPSLTIAANALRVADHLTQLLAKPGSQKD